ncbi:MAG: hypothetical protein M3285_10430 [Actinomycetota bacterium]|nr:hypothetical protein [Actinomycetota bacterium]
MKVRIVAAGLFLILLIGGQAHADDHRPPRARLQVGALRQEGLRYHAEWSSPDKDPRFCMTRFSDSWPSFRKAVLYSADDELVVRLQKASMPLEVEAYRWERLDDEGYGRGEPTPLASVLRPVIVNGATRAWEVVVVPDGRKRHLYFGVSAYWSDEDGCMSQPDLGSQGAGWTFHVKRAG